MRIIGGQWKGHNLVSFNEDHIRPTTDRVKESLFNIIQNHISQDSKILDLFSGTGNLGIEALSRGCQHATFIDDNIRSIQILKKNLQKLKVSSDSYKILKSDVFLFLKNYSMAEFDTLFIDPPFTKKLAHSVMSALAVKEDLQNESLIAIESVKGEKIEDSYNKINLIKRKSFGDKILSIYRV